MGGKGANLCEMTQIELNVPPGFVMTTKACLTYLGATNRTLPEGLMNEVRKQIKDIEKATGKMFGDVHPCWRGMRAFGLSNIAKA